MKESAYKELVRAVLKYRSSVLDWHIVGLRNVLESVQKSTAIFVTRYYKKNCEFGSITGIPKRRQDNRLCTKFRKVNPGYLQLTLSLGICVEEISPL